MIELATMEKISKHYAPSPMQFFRDGSILTLKQKRRQYQIEKIEILARYHVETVSQLNDQIESGLIDDHPAWEDLIEIKNIDAEVHGIENDIRTLQSA